MIIIRLLPHPISNIGFRTLLESFVDNGKFSTLTVCFMSLNVCLNNFLDNVIFVLTVCLCVCC